MQKRGGTNHAEILLQLIITIIIIVMIISTVCAHATGAPARLRAKTRRQSSASRKLGTHTATRNAAHCAGSPAARLHVRWRLGGADASEISAPHVVNKARIRLGARQPELCFFLQPSEQLTCNRRTRTSARSWRPRGAVDRAPLANGVTIASRNRAASGLLLGGNWDCCWGAGAPGCCAGTRDTRLAACVGTGPCGPAFVGDAGVGAG